MWKYLYEVALGLEYLHERGIVHGDLRCCNVLIASDGKAKLSNFGLSASTSRSSEVSAGAVGPLRWQAPEVLEGRTPSFESDVYSLGMCVLEATTGKEPWSQHNDSMVKSCKWYWKPEMPDSGFHPFCPNPAVRAFVWRMCCQGPLERAGLSSLVYDLERLATLESPKCAQPDQEPT